MPGKGAMSHFSSKICVSLAGSLPLFAAQVSGAGEGTITHPIATASCNELKVLQKGDDQ